MSLKNKIKLPSKTSTLPDLKIFQHLPRKMSKEITIFMFRSDFSLRSRASFFSAFDRIIYKFFAHNRHWNRHYQSSSSRGHEPADTQGRWAVKIRYVKRLEILHSEPYRLCKILAAPLLYIIILYFCVSIKKSADWLIEIYLTMKGMRYNGSEPLK